MSVLLSPAGWLRDPYHGFYCGFCRRFCRGFCRGFVLLIVLLAGARAPHAQASEQVVTVPLPDGRSIAYLLSQQDGAKPQWVLVMIPGSFGNLQLTQQADGSVQTREKNDFVIRTRTRVVDARFAAAIVDAPSDQPGGYSDAFRASPRNAQDVAQIAADLRVRFPGAKLVLIGISRGTISTAYLGRELPDTWDAVVHLSTLSSPARGQATPLIGFNYGSITARQLFVHHVDDSCYLCSFDAAKRIADSGGHALIAVHGGSAYGPPCEAHAHHGYNGQDDRVIPAIKAWIAGEAWPKEID